MMEGEDNVDVDALAKAIVDFFHALPRAAREEYDALAKKDREKGEDVSR
ncbi:MAG TPA: hypothetical protein VIF62_28375 [Labilithrix sp.]|jgi:hypothetical protein